MRNVFLNGVDISSAKSQDLKNVDVHISDNGDVYLVAPHYQVNEEDSFVPLSRYVQGLNQPQHQPAQKLNPTAPAVASPTMPASRPMPTASTTAPTPTPAPGDGLLPKAGEPVPAPRGEATAPKAVTSGAPAAAPVASAEPKGPVNGGPSAGSNAAAAAGATQQGQAPVAAPLSGEPGAGAEEASEDNDLKATGEAPAPR
jgi:hypothetical protein